MTDASDVTYTYNGQAGSSPNGAYDSSVAPVVKTSLLQNKSCDLGIEMLRTSQNMSTDPNAVKVGSYYYFEDGGPGSCGDSGDDSLADNLRQDFSLNNLVQQ
jgi:hypothetical protein